MIRLQSQGLPLEAIRALLEPDTVLAQQVLPRRLIANVLRAEPMIIDTLRAAGVLTVRPDGGLDLRSARAVLAAFAVGGGNAPILPALHALAASIAAALPHADATLSKVHQEIRTHLPRGDAQNDGLVEFVVEVVRVCLIQLLGEPPAAEPLRPSVGSPG